MTITELIAQLEAIRAEHGDITVQAYDPGYGGATVHPLERDDVYVPKGSDYVLLCP